MGFEVIDPPDAVLDPSAVVGSGAYQAATPMMELGALTPARLLVSPPHYELERLMVDAAHTGPHPPRSRFR